MGFLRKTLGISSHPPGKHERPKQCPERWSTRPESGAIPGAHYEHQCVNVPGHKGSHACRRWDCHETKD